MRPAVISIGLLKGDIEDIGGGSVGRGLSGAHSNWLHNGSYSDPAKNWQI